MADDGYAGFARPEDSGSDANAQTLLIKSILAEVHTATIVKVLAVRPGTGKVGRVDIQPAINQIDGAGSSTEHGTIFDVPYFRLQGGTNAIKMDPSVNDLGLAVFTSRDATNVKANADVANPGSRRRHSMADAFYFGGFLNGEPVQFIEFTEDRILVQSPKKITLSAPSVDIEGDSFTHNGVNVGKDHVHTKVSPGSGLSGVPKS